MNRIGFTGSGNHGTHGQKDQAFLRERTWLRSLVLFGFGGMIVTGLCLLSGCGSDSKPGAVDAKKEKTAASSKPMKSQAVVPLQNLGAAGGRKRQKRTA